MSPSSTSATELTAFLKSAVQAGDLLSDASSAILSLAEASVEIAGLAARNGISQTALGAVTGEENADGDTQKALDVLADQLIEKALAKTSLFAYLSEEREQPVPLLESGRLICACDPLDGSSNIDTNLTIGTIFSLYSAPDQNTGSNSLCPGRDQIAAGFFAYGPQTSLLLTYGKGVFAFCYDGNDYRLMDWQVKIPTQTSEFAINTANHRHWSARTASYIDQLLAGKQGGRGRNFNMRWAGSLVADSWRILRRGGIFLYPEDSRGGYETGRLRLVYEANPISFIVEQAGGLATDGKQNILDIQPTDLHQRVPLIFGSADEVNYYKMI